MIKINQGIPLLDSQKKLISSIDNLMASQLAFLDQAGKRIVELCTGLLALIFAFITLGDKIPPVFLENNEMLKIAICGVLSVILLSLFTSLISIQPYEFIFRQNNLTEMEKTQKKIIKHKAFWIKVSGILFFLAVFSLAVIIGFILFS